MGFDWSHPTNWGSSLGSLNVGGITAGDVWAGFGGSVGKLGEMSAGAQPDLISQSEMQGYPVGTPNPYSVGRVAAGQGILANQLMQGNAGYFAELDRQKTLAGQRGDLNTQDLDLQRQSLQGDFASKKAANALDTKDVSAQRNRLGMEPGFINREFGLNERTLTNQEGRSRDEFGTNLRNLYSDATARGALQTGGARSARDDLSKQLMRNLEDVGIGRGKNELGKERSVADNNLARQQLELQAQKIGLNGADLERQLNEGLAKIGLQGQVNALDLLDAMNSADIKKQQAVTEIWNSVTAAGKGVADLVQPTSINRPAGH